DCVHDLEVELPPSTALFRLGERARSGAGPFACPVTRSLAAATARPAPTASRRAARGLAQCLLHLLGFLAHGRELLSRIFILTGALCWSLGRQRGLLDRLDLLELRCRLRWLGRGKLCYI